MFRTWSKTTMLWACSPDSLDPVLASTSLTLIFPTAPKPVCLLPRFRRRPIPDVTPPDFAPFWRLRPFVLFLSWRPSARQARSRSSQRYDLSPAVGGLDELENHGSHVIFLAPPKFSSCVRHCFLSKCLKRLFFSIFFVREIGNGATTLFWKDNWIHGKSIGQLVPRLLDAVPKRMVNSERFRKPF
jgi:hypothetical protein